MKFYKLQYDCHKMVLSCNHGMNGTNWLQLVKKRNKYLAPQQKQLKEFSFKILLRSIDPLFIPCKSCAKTFERNEKVRIECYSIRNILVEYVTILKLRNIYLSE
eukprot:Pgem_evm1s16215